MQNIVAIVNCFRTEIWISKKSFRHKDFYPPKLTHHSLKEIFEDALDYWPMSSTFPPSLSKNEIYSIDHNSYGAAISEVVKIGSANHNQICKLSALDSWCYILTSPHAKRINLYCRVLILQSHCSVRNRQHLLDRAACRKISPDRRDHRKVESCYKITFVIYWCLKSIFMWIFSYE